jgi:hypothetical protein
MHGQHIDEPARLRLYRQLAVESRANMEASTNVTGVGS